MSEEYQENGRKQETEHIVAFFDLLGASQIIAGKDGNRTSESTLNDISELFQICTTHLPQMGGTGGLSSALTKLKSATFSDNIVFALDLSEILPTEKKNAISDFIFMMAGFQGFAMDSHFLFRGGVSLGPLYMNTRENFVWGQALVDAHYLEEKVAIYPRTVLSREFEKRDYVSFVEPIFRDFDGMYYLDYMSEIVGKDTEKVNEIMDLINQEQDKSWGNERIFQKYAWLRDYIERCQHIWVEL